MVKKNNKKNKITWIDWYNQKSTADSLKDLRYVLTVINKVIAYLTHSVRSWFWINFRTPVSVSTTELPINGTLHDPTDPVKYDTALRCLEALQPMRITEFLEKTSKITHMHYWLFISIIRAESPPSPTLHYDIFLPSTAYFKMNSNKAAVKIFCDLTKTFDCVNYTVL